MFKMLNPIRFYHAVGKRRFWEFIILAVFLLFFYGPMVNMFMLAFANKYDAPSVFPQVWGLKYWKFVFSQENLVSSIGQSFLIAFITMAASMVLAQRNAGSIPDTIKVTSITPSFTGSVQSLSIPSFGSNSEGAYAFMNYMLSDEAQDTLVKQMAAIPLVSTANIDMTGYEDLKTLDVSKFRILSIGDLSNDFNERWDNEISTLG